GEHERGALEQVPGPVLDGGDGLVDAERVDGQVPGVGHLEVGERGRGQGRVVGPQQPRGLADVRRAEPRAGPVADAAVERHAEHGGVQAADVGGPRQPGKGGLARVPRDHGGVHLADGVAYYDPRYGFGHESCSPAATSITRSSRSLASMADCSAATFSDRDSSRYTRPDTARPTSQE